MNVVKKSLHCRSCFADTSCSWCLLVYALSFTHWLAAGFYSLAGFYLLADGLVMVW
jgi:hypothetical protein